ncbi:MAG: GNAT family N-acetyltransferase [Mycobacteriales bacterium]
MSKDPAAGIDLRSPTADEMFSVLAVIERAFGEDVQPAYAERELALMPPGRALAAFDGTDAVAGGGMYEFEMTVPGGPTPVAGVTWVGVLPTHRRRGILSAMMRRQLSDLHEQQREPVAALWASEPEIYRRFGYGNASKRLNLKVQSGLPFVPGAPAGSPGRMIGVEQARETLAQIYDRARLARPGFVSRSTARWDSILDDSEQSRRGAGSLTCVVLESGDGYVLYRTKPEQHDGIAAGKVTVRELIAVDGAAHAALWRYLLDMDLISTVEAWNVAMDDPLPHLVANVRRLHPSYSDALWVRIVDVVPALAARTYASADSVVIEVIDVECPWNAGRFALDVAGLDSPGVVARTDRSADITLSAVELGAAYLGGTRLRSLAAAGFVDEHTPGAVTRADRLFTGALEPWIPEVF